VARRLDGVDENRVAELHERYRAAGRTVHDDGGYMRRGHPTFTDALPRY